MASLYLFKSFFIYKSYGNNILSKKVEDRIIEKFTNLIQRYKDKDELYLTNSDLSMPRGEWESTE